MTPHRKITAAPSSPERSSFYWRNQLRTKISRSDSSTVKIIMGKTMPLPARYARNYVSKRPSIFGDAAGGGERPKSQSLAEYT